MFQIDNGTASPVLPGSTPVGTPGFFSDGNPAAGVGATILSAEFMNMLMLEMLGVLTEAGIAPAKATFNQLATAIKTIVQTQAPKMSVAGSIRNGKMLSGGSASATFSADEIIVETALGGMAYQLANFSKVINLAAIGVGGMDAGTAPASGYVALYAIYNPTTNTQDILATNATNAAVGNVYGGARMPAGYTASALISVWPTNASGQFVPGVQSDRTIEIPPTLVISTSAQTIELTTLSIAAAVPLNAKSCSGYMSATAASGVGIQLAVAATSGSVGQQLFTGYTGSAGQAVGSPFNNLVLFTPQTIFWLANLFSGGFGSATILITKYEF